MTIQNDRQEKTVSAGMPTVSQQHYNFVAGNNENQNSNQVIRASTFHHEEQLFYEHISENDNTENDNTNDLNDPILQEFNQVLFDL